MATEQPKITGNTVLPGVNNFDITSTLDAKFKEKIESPVDAFLRKGIELNKLLTNTNPPTILANLIILGYVSAVESYFREISRRLILIDEISNEACEDKKISFGTVMAQLENISVLPEALFEEISFTSKKNILSALGTFLNISVSEKDNPDLILILNQFSEICELRHCIAHRFGRFGSKNAISLGMKKHKTYIEKPIICNYNSLQEIITICQNTVRVANNVIFEKIMLRMVLSQKSDPKNKQIWTWDYNSDKSLFYQFYYLFYSFLNKPDNIQTPKKVYDNFHKYFKAIN